MVHPRGRGEELELGEWLGTADHPYVLRIAELITHASRNRRFLSKVLLADCAGMSAILHG